MTEAGNPSDRPMVVAVCAYRVENVEKHFRHNIAQLRGDEYLVLLDRPHSARADEVAEKVRAEGGRMEVLGANNGLSASRNRVLAARPGHHILFVDEDVRIDASTVDEVRAAFHAGANVVGARLVRPAEMARLPRLVTSGQFHLIGWHRPQGTIKIWGACMGVDSAFATAHALDFDLALSRTGGGLQSGEDTSFIRAMKQAGARERLLEHVAVVHDVDPARLRPRYLLRRAYWQGRSEVRRGSALPGLRKELGRYRTAPEAPVRALLLTLVYGGATVLGMAHEFWSARRRSHVD